MAFREDISPTETKFVRSASDANTARRDRYLRGPFVDFICLGGGSLLILPLIFVLPLEQYQAPIGHAFLFVSFVLNYPHFANSYQIFYRNFHRKAFSKDYQAALRARYIVAGIVVPAALAWFFASSVLTDIPHIPSKFVEIVPLSHRQGNCIPYAAIRWHDFGNRPALGRPLGHFSRHPDTPLLSLSPRRRFPRPTPERVFVADHQSSSGFSGTGPSAPPPQPIGT